MGKCIFCNEKAGFFNSRHKECQLKHLDGRLTIVNVIHKSFLNNSINDLTEKINIIAKESYINELNMKNLIVEGWEKSVESAFEDGLLSEQEQQSLEEIVNNFELDESEINRNRAYTKVMQGKILRNVVNGIMPAEIDFSHPIPFNFKKKESLIWLENNVDYIETKTKTSYVGGSAGVSVKIAKGVYYRTSSFKGDRVRDEVSEIVDSGLFGITNQHIYFCGDRKSFRVPFAKIVSFKAFSDGIGIHKEGVTAKPQAFVTADAWFIYNLVANISNLED